MSDQVRIVDGQVYVNDVPLNDDYVPAEYRMVGVRHVPCGVDVRV